MPSAAMNRLMDNARVNLPGALDSVIQLELFNTLNEFFQDSNIWYEDIQFEAVATSADPVQDPAAYTYTITPTMGVIVRLIGVGDSNNFPQAATMATPGEIFLLRSPNYTQTYTARVAITVDDPVTRDGYPECPDWIINKYTNELAEGVIGRMMGQPAKPYSSPQLAQYHLRRFKQGVSQAKVEALHKNVYRGQSWSFPQTFARRRFVKF